MDTTSAPKATSITPLTPENVEVGDIIVARYVHSQWAKIFPWEDWHHAALVTKVHPLTIIEAAGVNKANQPEGPVEILFEDSVSFGKSVHAGNLIKMKWLKPVFPKKIRELPKKKTKISERKILTEAEARKKVVAYARAQVGEPYRLMRASDGYQLADLISLWQMGSKHTGLVDEAATKWDENEWYCSLLVYKAYSRSITNMYLEAQMKADLHPDVQRMTIKTGFMVTPEDLVDSPRTQVYFTWAKAQEVPPSSTIA